MVIIIMFHLSWDININFQYVLIKKLNVCQLSVEIIIYSIGQLKFIIVDKFIWSHLRTISITNLTKCRISLSKHVTPLLVNISEVVEKCCRLWYKRHQWQILTHGFEIWTVKSLMDNYWMPLKARSSEKYLESYVLRLYGNNENK